MQSEFNLYKVDMKYIRNLHNIDDKVLSVSPQTGKDNRDFSKIEVDGKLLGVLNFNLMIPIEKNQLQMIDTNIHKRDREKIKVYKRLCLQELKWCQENSETVCNKANVLYKKYMSGEEFAGKKRCLNFPRLEQECRKYNSNQHTS